MHRPSRHHHSGQYVRRCLLLRCGHRPQHSNRGARFPCPSRPPRFSRQDVAGRQLHHCAMCEQELPRQRGHRLAWHGRCRGRRCGDQQRDRHCRTGPGRTTPTGRRAGEQRQREYRISCPGHSVGDRQGCNRAQPVAWHHGSRHSHASGRGSGLGGGCGGRCCRRQFQTFRQPADVPGRVSRCHRRGVDHEYLHTSCHVEHRRLHRRGRSGITGNPHYNEYRINHARPSLLLVRRHLRSHPLRGRRSGASQGEGPRVDPGAGDCGSHLHREGPRASRSR